MDQTIGTSRLFVMYKQSSNVVSLSDCQTYENKPCHISASSLKQPLPTKSTSLSIPSLPPLPLLSCNNVPQTNLPLDLRRHPPQTYPLQRSSQSRPQASRLHQSAVKDKANSSDDHLRGLSKNRRWRVGVGVECWDRRECG